MSKKNKKKQKICFQKKYSKLIWVFFVGIVTILSFWIMVYTRISITPHDKLDDNNILSTPFIITNNGHFRLNNIQTDYYINSLEAVGPSWKQSIGNSVISIEAENVPQLEKGEETTIFIASPIKFSKPITSADVEFQIYYKSFWLPWRKMKRIRFITIKDSKGVLRWFPYAKSKKIIK